MAEKELNSDYFIKHHLQNLTFGQCSDGKWRFADGHINLGAEHTAHQEKGGILATLKRWVLMPYM